MDSQLDNELGRSVAAEYETTDERSGWPVLPIYLDFDADENFRSVATLEFENGGTGKLVSSESA